MAFASIHLRTLDLDPDTIYALPEAEQKKMIRKQYLKLSYENHPDTNANKDNSKIRSIISAYQALMNDDNDVKDSVASFTGIQIPETAFDLLLQEGIYEANCALKREQLLIESDRERQLFNDHYQAFFDLAESLAKKQSDLAHKRVHYLKEKNESLQTILTQAWRELIIRLFAEEYLSDFQYRQALATGDLWPILATRKLLSPLKWIAAIFNTIGLSVSLTIDYLYKLAGEGIVNFLRQGNLDWKEMGLLVLRSVSICVLPTLAFIFAPMTVSFVIGLPAIMALIETIASPVNRIIRPLATYTNLPPALLLGIFVIVGALAAYSAFSMLAMSSLIVLISYVNLAVCLYAFYEMAKLCVNLYEKYPVVAFALGTFFIASIAISFFLPQPVIEGLVSWVNMLCANLSNAAVLYKVNVMLDDPTKAIVEQLENLPLPEQPVSEFIQKSTLLGYKAATQSHRFFNSPKDAQYVEASKMTTKQQAASFFGGGANKISYCRPVNDHDVNESCPDVNRRLYSIE